METIYGNATVTIAAAGGSDSKSGCFIKDSSDSNYLLDKIKLRLPGLSIGTISIRGQNVYDLSMDPLNKRAWAL